MSSFFNPPQYPQDGEGYTFGNVVWEFEKDSGVWNIKDGTLVGTDGVGVSGFFVAQEGDPNFTGGHLYFYYVYPDGATSNEIDAGSVVTQANASVADPGITFTDSFGVRDRIELGETLSLTGTSGLVTVRNAGSNTFRFDVRHASTSVTGVAWFDSSHFEVSDGSGVAAGRVSLKTSLTITGDTVTGPNASVKVTKTANVATIDARMSSNSLTGVASFDDRYFSVGNTGHVSLAAAYQATGNTVVGSGPISVSTSNNVATVGVGLAGTNGTTGVAAFNSNQFTINGQGVVSLSSAFSATGDSVTGPNASIKVTKTENVATIDARMGDNTLTGVASFDNRYFSVGNSGHVSLASSYQATGNTVIGPNASIKVTTSGNVATIDARMGDTSLTGVASFDNRYFSVGNTGHVSLASSYQATGNTVIGPNASIKVTTSGNVATIDARMSSNSLTGVASFDNRYFSIGNSGHVSLAAAYQATGSTVQGNGAISVDTSGSLATVKVRLAEASVTGVAMFPTADFVVANTGSVSLTGGLVRSVNGVTGDVAKGTPANRVFYSNNSKGITTSDKFLFDGTSLTFSGTDFNLGSVNMIGGVFSQHKEKGATRSLGPNSSTLTIDPADGYYQKIAWDTSSVSNGTVLQVTVSDINWTTTANQVESIVAVILQQGKGLSAQFASKILNEGSRYFMGSTGSVDVVTVSRYAIDSTNGLTMGFIIAKGMTSGGFKFV